MSTATIASPRRSRWIPCVFIGGFLLVVAVNAVMITFAVRSFTGVTTTEPYTKGLRFNEQIREAEAYERLGWQVAARFRPAGAQRGVVEIELTSRDGAPIADATVIAEFSRPVEKDRDFTLTLRHQGGGRYVGTAEFPLAGVWDVKYRIERGAQALTARDRLQVER
jgi:nitrogen fixation protein FixH